MIILVLTIFMLHKFCHEFFHFKGVQAQTLANFYLAFESELTIIPVMNKIDLKVARPDEVSKQMQTMFDLKESEIIRVSF